VTRRRRAAVLIGLSIILGALAASDVSGREAALRREIGPAVPVLVARRGVAAGARLDPAVLAVRHVPSRYAPAGAYRAVAEVSGLRAAVPIPAGADLDPALVDDGTTSAGPAGPDLRDGERVAQVVAVGPAASLGPGARVDVVVTREGAGGGAGSTTLALEDVQVLAATRAPASGNGRDADLPRVALDLRVSVRQAVYLAAAQSFAREVRVLPRAPGDRRRGAQGLRVGGSL
jgi:pilus assembly protein CpaB